MAWKRIREFLLLTQCSSARTIFIYKIVFKGEKHFHQRLTRDLFGQVTSSLSSTKEVEQRRYEISIFSSKIGRDAGRTALNYYILGDGRRKETGEAGERAVQK